MQRLETWEEQSTRKKLSSSVKKVSLKQSELLVESSSSSVVDSDIADEIEYQPVKYKKNKELKSLKETERLKKIEEETLASIATCDQKLTKGEELDILQESCRNYKKMVKKCENEKKSRKKFMTRMIDDVNSRLKKEEFLDTIRE
mmetsp:Transcript_31812/g.23544  ORF Transcript_31812/g.23544 Transcript_31812/m.23544 type:complete len:145 (+) Transcript_31812:320-754(+)|eukprot:CAMPEP_0202970228 /NCGR_PEP_ID=MMETSP1396-20130829/16221_1 /ASSEMBLY_ACC=CAM_ASM_000872 /TAXON_ID= /ORGANISM="Pseudokeronopsis sp., Strain Brazil" /LENGTH=144 /DNA_ID=CAMNT_0049698611 /DNA_START=34 /DNA_END=468 /DNA_ORIENTATION=+